MEHYKSMGVNAIDVLQSKRGLETLFYIGETRPHIWWEGFEKELTSALNTLDRKEWHEVYSSRFWDLGSNE